MAVLNLKGWAASQHHGAGFAVTEPSPGSARTSVITSFPRGKLDPPSAELTGGADARRLHSLFGLLLGYHHGKRGGTGEIPQNQSLKQLQSLARGPQTLMVSSGSNRCPQPRSPKP